MLNQCGVCGKFRSWSQLTAHYSPDNHFSGEDGWFECTFCIEKQTKRNNDPTFKLITAVERDLLSNSLTAKDYDYMGLSAQLKVAEKLSLYDRLIGWICNKLIKKEYHV